MIGSNLKNEQRNIYSSIIIAKQYYERLSKLELMPASQMLLVPITARNSNWN